MTRIQKLVHEFRRGDWGNRPHVCRLAAFAIKKNLSSETEVKMYEYMSTQKTM